ncbi:MAG: 5'-deoxynucleotidase [Chitinivibrionales bacterium]|nr:5'-deoxynucleotidase [Chitinivibrionales bacterium]
MSHFFAYLSRMRYIQRWSLMRNMHAENIQEHSLQVAMVSHALALIRNEQFGGDTDPNRVALLALFHDVGEVITGDLATPIKYFNPSIKSAYDEIDVVARRKLLDMLPSELREHYAELLFADEKSDDWKLVKAADRICAYLKCLEELKAGNREFARAEKTVKKTIDAIELPEVDYFMKRFVPSFMLTLDELN